MATPNDNSAQPCGCDSGAGWTCMQHQPWDTWDVSMPPLRTLAPEPPPIDERQWRKQRPLFSGVLKYFPDALLEVAYCSFIGNEQHNPGEPLHWAKEKSTDEPDALVRHLVDPQTHDTDGVRHRAKAAWRALAYLQREIEAERGKK